MNLPIPRTTDECQDDTERICKVDIKFKNNNSEDNRKNLLYVA